MALNFLGVPLGLALWLYAHRTGRSTLARTLLLTLYLGLLMQVNSSSTSPRATLAIIS
jgi:hypothetical protein